MISLKRPVLHFPDGDSSLVSRLPSHAACPTTNNAGHNVPSRYASSPERVLKLPYTDALGAGSWAETPGFPAPAGWAAWGGSPRRGYTCPALPLTRNPPGDRAEHASMPVSIQWQDHGTVWKSITQGGQKSMKPPTNPFRNLTMLTQGSSNWNFKYKIQQLPYTRQCSPSCTEILYRGWGDCLCPPAGEDGETSHSRCSALSQKTVVERDKQWEAKQPSAISLQKEFLPHYSIKNTGGGLYFHLVFLGLAFFFSLRQVSS